MNPDTRIQLGLLGSAFGEALLSRVPGGVGLLADTFIRYRNLIKQERVCDLLEELKKDIESMDLREFDQEYLGSEEFSDILESILWRVVNTASEEKVHRFKKILLNEMKHTYESDFKETFLDIALRINEDQILILDHFREIRNSEPESSSERGFIQSEDAGDEGTRAHLNRERGLLGFDESKYLFYVQDLVSKSLLCDKYVGVYGGAKPYTNLRITPFGEEFLKFIEGSPDQ
ncbi:MAG: hypothetical protein WC102_10950 [Saccharofermentanales bacterium]|jgi:hypothetical protein